jgi:predicted phage-related endonuclease
MNKNEFLITHDVAPGSDEWLDLRKIYMTASEAPVMMGDSLLMRRDQLIMSNAHGIINEVSDFVNRVIFPRGHETEANARPMAEETIMDDLLPLVVSRGDYLASLDGATENCAILWEHKQWSQILAGQVRRAFVPNSHAWQLDHQLYVTGAQKMIFMVSDGTRENMVWCWYNRDESRIQQLLAGWDQFLVDVQAYTDNPGIAKSTPKAIATKPGALPALFVKVVGQVTESNLNEYREAALNFISGISTTLITDQQFADAEASAKFCKSSEVKLDQVKSDTLDQAKSISDLYLIIDEIKEAMRDKRLTLEKLVKTEKAARQTEIINEGQARLTQATLDAESKIYPIKLHADIPSVREAIKGLKTLDSMRSRINDQVAKSTMELNRVAEKVRANLAVITNAGRPALFADSQSLCYMPERELDALIDSRISADDAEIARRAEAVAETARIQEVKRANAAAVESAREAEAKLVAEAQLAPKNSHAEIIQKENEEFSQAIMPATQGGGLHTIRPGSARHVPIKPSAKSFQYYNVFPDFISAPYDSIESARFDVNHSAALGTITIAINNGRFNVSVE